MPRSGPLRAVPLTASDAVADRLTVGIVVFRPDLDLLSRCLERLADAVRVLDDGPVRIAIIDNGPPGGEPALDALLASVRAVGPPFALDLIRGQGNVGYGHANNLAIERSGAPLHLVLNPDAELDRDALRNGVARLDADPTIGMVAAWVVEPDGSATHLCKTYPSVLVLAMRALGLPWFARRVAAYDLEPAPGDATDATGALVSGSFMLCRTSMLKAVGGFDPSYFLYFEDFDLSLRIARVGRIVLARDVRIVHHGGAAGGKGARHVRMFAASAARFFSRHGWRWW